MSSHLKHTWMALSLIALCGCGKTTGKDSKRSTTPPPASATPPPASSSSKFTAGFVFTNMGVDPYSDDDANSIAIHSDGKIISAGDVTNSGGTVFALTRHNADGTLDTTFNSTGKVTTFMGTDVGNLRDVALQSDGKIVVIGRVGSDFVVIRYNSNGSLDTGFNSTGIVTTNLGGSDSPFDVAVQSDGKIIVVGNSGDNYAVVRYNANGSLDTSFNGTGIVSMDVSGRAASDGAGAVAIQSDGKIIVAGNAHISGPGGLDISVVRYNSDGSLDTTFNSTGIVTQDLSSSDNAVAVAIQSNGKIVVGGASQGASQDFAVIRYNADGSIDTSFNTTGIVTTDLNAGTFDQMLSLAIQGDGKIVAAGSSQGGSEVASIVRYNSDGSLDTGFGGTGKVMDGIVLYPTMALQSNGKIMLAGYFDNGPSYDFRLTRFNTDGTLDTGFNGTGLVDTDIGESTNDYGMASAVQSDGKVVVAGTISGLADEDIIVFRYNTDGSLDTSFNGTGKVRLDIGSEMNDFASAVAIQSDGKIVVVGYSDASFSEDVAVVRYNANGTLDTTFNSTGIVTTDISGGGSSDKGTAVAILSSGKILVAGYTNSGGSMDFLLIRYNSDGSLDTTFNGTGKVQTDVVSADNDVLSAMAIQSDGKILLGGTSNGAGSNDFVIIRYNSDGSLDTNFNSTGKVILDIGASSDDILSSIQVQSDGKIVAAGKSDTAGNDYDVTVVRYNSNGSLDTTFNSTGKVVTDLGASGDTDAINSMQIQSDGKIIIGGRTAWDDYDFLVVRYNSNGSLDTTLDSDGILIVEAGAEDSVGSLISQSDNSFVIVGSAYNAGSIDVVVAGYTEAGIEQ